jgi:hypothetical protein
MGPESKDTSDPGINLRIIQLDRDGAVGTAGPRIHPQCHIPPSEWLNATADEGPQEVHACELIL